MAHERVLVIFVSFVILGGILLPALAVFLTLSGIGWEICAVLSLAFITISLILSKRLEKVKKAEYIREGVQSKRRWMSLADFGARYGRIQMRGKKEIKDEDGWSYLRKALDMENSKKR